MNRALERGISERLDARDTVAPSRSESFNDVLACAGQSGADPDALARLFWLMNAHPRLLGHRRCLQNLPCFWQTPDFIDGARAWAGSWIDDLPAWSIAAQWAANISGSVLSKLADFAREPKDALHHVLMRHGINRHSIAGVLSIRHHADVDPSIPTHNLPRAAKHFRLLQWHLFTSHAEARHHRSTLDQYLQYDRPSEWPAWPRPAAEIGLAMRHMSYAEGDALLESLTFEPQLDLFVENLAGRKKELTDIFRERRERPQLAAILNYFEDFKLYFSGMPVQRRRGNGGGTGGARIGVPGYVHFAASPQVFFQPPESDSRDSDVPWRDATRVFIHPQGLTPDALGELEEVDIAPADDLQPVMDLFPIDGRPGGVHGLWTMRTTIEAAAQRFYWDKSQLTPNELAALLGTIDPIALKADHAEALATQTEAALLIRCMLTFGCKQEEARTVRSMWTSDFDALVATGGEVLTRVVLVCPNTGLCAGFALPAIHPRYRSPPSQTPSTIARPVTGCLRLPDVLGLGDALLERQRHADVEVGGAIFSQPADALEAEIRHCLMKVNERLDDQSRPRVTAIKISRKLPSVLSRAGLDDVGVALVCGDRQYESEARLHYTQHRQEALQKAYDKAIRRIHVESGRPIRTGNQFKQPDSPARVGARFIVEDESLRRFLSNLRLEIRKRPPSRRSSQHRYHRAFILYTWLMQSLLTTVRPSAHPERLLAQLLRHECHLGIERRILPIIEKDDQYQALARPAVILPRLQRQYHHALKHASETWRWRPPDVSFPCVSPAQSVFLDWDGDQPQPVAEIVSPKWLASQLIDFGLPVPANFARGFMRTWLLKDGCSEQIVDAFLGHSGIGKSSVSMTATFDYSAHFRELNERLDHMAKSLGLDPVASLLAGD